ncbi:MAG: DNA polymerase ligase N-terminal domain-containing protein [Thermoguttaceae bacterium]
MLFVILKHTLLDGSYHFDFMFECGAALLTWSVPAKLVEESETSKDKNETLTKNEFRNGAVTRLPDHRKIYLEYEGEISKGRGSVERIDTGTWNGSESTQLDFFGKKYSGTIRLENDIWQIVIRNY